MSDRPRKAISDMTEDELVDLFNKPRPIPRSQLEEIVSKVTAGFHLDSGPWPCGLDHDAVANLKNLASQLTPVRVTQLASLADCFGKTQQAAWTWTIRLFVVGVLGIMGAGALWLLRKSGFLLPASIP